MSAESLPRPSPGADELLRASAAAPAPDFALAVSRAMGVVVVTAHGHLDDSSAAVLRAVLIDLIEGQGNLRVFVDLLDMTVPDHLELGDLVSSAAAAARLGGELTFADPSDVMIDALTHVGLGSCVSTGHTRLRSLARPMRTRRAPGARTAAMAEHPAGTGGHADDWSRRAALERR